MGHLTNDPAGENTRHGIPWKKSHMEYWSLLEQYGIKGWQINSSSKHQGCCKGHVFPLSLGAGWGGKRGKRESKLRA